MTKQELVDAIDEQVLHLQAATTPKQRREIWQRIIALRADLNHKNKTSEK